MRTLPEALCVRCCNSASESCANECAQGPVVECSDHGRTLTKPAPVLARACSLCLGHPAPGETCVRCGGQGEPFRALPEFAVSDHGEVERDRTAEEHALTLLREAREHVEALAVRLILRRRYISGTPEETEALDAAKAWLKASSL